jgi:hypothetical protein
MRRRLLEEIVITVCVLLGVASAVIAEATGVSALKGFGIAMVVAGTVAIAAKDRG